jgi:hypothetical protein
VSVKPAEPSEAASATEMFDRSPTPRHDCRKGSFWRPQEAELAWPHGVVIVYVSPLAARASHVAFGSVERSKVTG